MQLQTPQGTPAWADGREQRLLVSMLLAVFVVAGLLSVLRIPAVPDFTPLVDLIVRIVQQQPLEQPETDEQPKPAEPDAARPAEEISEPPPQSGGREDAPPEIQPRIRIDWPAARAEAIREYLDRLERPPSINPVQDELRRRFAGQYRPRTRPGPRPIWENVERDQLGRSVLRSGDCFKVLDDPNVGSRYAFETFGQFTPMCTFQKRLPRQLPWVAIIRERYDYLTSQDYYLVDQTEPESLTSD